MFSQKYIKTYKIVLYGVFMQCILFCIFAIFYSLNKKSYVSIF